MLEAVAETSATTVEIVTGIRQQMADLKHRLRDDLPKIYSQELLNNLFRHPYTRIEYLQNDLDVSRQTAAKYLDTLAKHGFVEKHRSGKHNYFINVARALVKLFLDVSGGP
ncbi:UNVERIFIED_CONTAM: fic [Trichonephila clavipes]